MAPKPAKVSGPSLHSTTQRAPRGKQSTPPLVEHKGGSVYWVSSKSEPAIMREVDAAAGTCTCPAMTDYGKTTCRHLAAVRPLWLAEQARRAEEEAREAAKRAAPVAAIQQRVVAQMGMLSPAQQATWRLLSDYGEGAVFGPEVR